MLNSEFQILFKIWKCEEVHKPVIIIFKKCLKILWKICYKDILLSNYHAKFIFFLAVAVEGSRVGFFSFSLYLLFHVSLVLKQIVLFRKKKFGGEILNWISNLNVENIFFPIIWKLIFPSFIFSSWKKSDLIFIGSNVDMPNLPTYFPILVTFFIINEAF